MGSRGGGGGLQGLLEHAAREYEKVETVARGPEEAGSEHTSAVAVLKRSNRPAGSAKSSGSADPEEQGADRITRNGGDGSSPRGAGTPSRKRQRVDAGPPAVSPSPCGGGGQGLNSPFSEDGGGSAGESYGGDAEASAGKDGTGTNPLAMLHFFSWLEQWCPVC